MNRDAAIDLLKTIAILGVLVIHISTEGFTYPVGSGDWTATLFLGSAVRVSVPLFSCAAARCCWPRRRTCP